MERQGLYGYARHTVSVDGGPIRTAEGVRIETTPISRFQNAEIDTIVVPGALDLGPALADRRLVDWLATHAPKVRRTASGLHSAAAPPPPTCACLLFYGRPR
jgi:transcriptional regulator GlxA family with amidase domain